jgi:hydroxyethylthiazole kinase-like uncharacterized protein yjeF
MGFPSELLTPDEMGAVDRAAPGLGVPGIALMENAGRAVARAIRRRLSPCRVLVLCGPGNNGGDGYVVARHLAQEGWPVTVAALAEPKPGTDAAAMAAQWDGPNAAFSTDSVRRADLVIDAVFGAGLSRDLDDVVSAVLSAAKQIVAVDVPSGVDGSPISPSPSIASSPAISCCLGARSAVKSCSPISACRPVRSSEVR